MTGTDSDDLVVGSTGAVRDQGVSTSRLSPAIRSMS